MTDKQIVNVFLSRVKKRFSMKNPQIVITQQYGKHLYFGVYDMPEGPFSCIFFVTSTKSSVFKLPELPDRLIEWKHQTLNALKHNNFIAFNIDNFPKEIVHIFISAVISALSANKMGITLMAHLKDLPMIFNPDETYEEVSIEADLMSFNDECN